MEEDGTSDYDLAAEAVQLEHELEIRRAEEMMDRQEATAIANLPRPDDRPSLIDVMAGPPTINAQGLEVNEHGDAIATMDGVSNPIIVSNHVSFVENDDSVTFQAGGDVINRDGAGFVFNPVTDVQTKKRKKKPEATVEPAKLPEETDFVKKIREIVGMSFKPEDFDICKINTSHFGLMLRWPFLKMTNKHGKNHDIKDMLVGLPFYGVFSAASNLKTVKNFGYGINGGRGTISLAEQISRYRHSHLHSGSNQMSVFCTGVDDINASWTDLKLMRVTNKDFDIKLEAFLHQLTAFLRYESIEGTPYIRFGTISLGNRGSYGNHTASQEAERYRSLFDRNAISMALDFNAGEVELIESDEFHSDLARHVSTHQKRLSNGNYVDIDSDSSRSSTRGGIHISGSGYYLHGPQRIYVEPLELSIPEGDNFKKYAHKFIIDNVRSKFKAQGTGIIQSFCTIKRVRDKDEENGSSSDWPIFNGGNTLLPVETTESRVVRTSVLAT